MVPFMGAAQLKILALCVIMSLVVFAARCKYNRHCPVCHVPVAVECGLTRGLLCFINDYIIVHDNCLDVWHGEGRQKNYFSLEGSEKDSQKHSG